MSPQVKTKLFKMKKKPYRHNTEEWHDHCCLATEQWSGLGLVPLSSVQRCRRRMLSRGPHHGILTRRHRWREVYCCLFEWPCSPLTVSASDFGTTTRKSKKKKCSCKLFLKNKSYNNIKFLKRYNVYLFIWQRNLSYRQL